MNDYELRSRIMRRVWAVYFLRTATSLSARLIALGAVTLALVSNVSVSNVIQNALQSDNLVRFSFAAVTGTTSVVQLCTLLVLALALWMTRDLLRGQQEGTGSLA